MDAPPAAKPAGPHPGGPARAGRLRWVVVGVLVVVLAGLGGVWGWRAVTDQTAVAATLAEQVAHDLTERTITDGTFGSTAGPAEQADLVATLKGMGTLRPVITVDALRLDDDQRSGTARLRAEWTIHRGKPTWIQDAYVRLVRGRDGWTAVWSRDLIASGLESGDRLRAVRLAPERGEVISADEERLAWNQDAKQVGLDKSLVEPAEQPAAARALARAVDIDPDGYAAKVAAYGPKAFVEATVVPAVGSNGWASVARARGVDGVRVFDVVRPLPMSSDFARPLLGSVGEATAEIIKASGGSIREGDLVGVSGLQKARNEQLMGVTGFVVQAYPDGHVEQARELFRVPAVDGLPLRVTLVAAWQRRAEAMLGSTGRRALVAIRPSDGAVLMLASTADTDTATSRQVYPDAFAPVTVPAKTRPGGLDDAVAALGLDGPAGIGVAVLLADTEDGTLRLSTYALAAAMASVGRGESIRPHLFAEEPQPSVEDGLTDDEIAAIRAAMRSATASGPLKVLAGLSGPKPLAAGDGTLWTVVLHGDLVVAGYDADGRSAAQVARFLRTVHG